MSIFLRLLGANDKETSLLESVNRPEKYGYSVEPNEFRNIDGSPFAYWISPQVRKSFTDMPSFAGGQRAIKQGIATADDFRFVRIWWEPSEKGKDWVTFAKGGSFSPYYAPQNLLVQWKGSGSEIRNFIDPKNGKLRSRPQNIDFSFRPGLTWSDRTTKSLSARIWPEGGVFSVKGSCGFFPGEEFFAAGIMNSIPFNYLIGLLVGAGDAAARSYQVGTIGKVPYPEYHYRIDELARTSWSLKRSLDTIVETSHAFVLPNYLRSRIGEFEPTEIQEELIRSQAEIDVIAFDLYGFSDADRAAAVGSSGWTDEDASDATEDADDIEDDDGTEAIDQTDGLLCWAAGVAFGRFDWRLATGERDVPPEPDPFDPLPTKSPGMLPDGAAPFHAHRGILVDDPGHPYNLPRLIEEVLVRVQVDVPGDVRRWLQREFFSLHLRQYSKSRRKAPIYWPLSTTSGSYTLWLYYPDLTSQTLYSAVNDFLEPKLTQVGREADAIRVKGAARSRDDEKAFEELQALELELNELRDTLLKIAPTYRPNHDDGVQITAAPLWQLFRHKPWQKLLKDTLAKLEEGEYDWSHLAMAYWPDRVREKCKTDKSLAIAHDLEHLYVEPEPKPAMAGGRKKRSGA
ncbi:MAG: type II restriction endonuclease subunit M [Alphaproteobacteria bacterium]|nr:MAG: type II restriction endonuclease subunit M [Alphaproteobacteria bacterium]